MNREKHPKLATMLFIGHAGAVAANAGKVYFSQNPMAINYPEWIAFVKHPYSQLKWCIAQKPKLRDDYVLGRINEELNEVLQEVRISWESISGMSS